VIAQIHSEWIKFRTVRSTVVLAIISVVGCVGVAIIAAAITDGALSVSTALVGVQISSLFIMVLGVQIIGQEYRFATIRPTFSATPRRERVVIAKLVVVIATVAVAAVALIALSLAAAAMVSSMRGNSFDLGESGNARVLIGTVAILVINGIFGFGIGCLVRQPIAGIVIVLVWVTVVESLIAGLVEGAARWLPLFSMANVNAQSVSSNSGFMGPVLGALYGAAVALALVALGAVRIRSMDA
jgi:ABC-2 type transport system permease protein